MTYINKRIFVILAGRVIDSLIDFPITINFNSNNFDFTKVRADGFDIEFFDSNDNPLVFEREHFDQADLSGIFHIKIPLLSAINETRITIKHNDAGQSIDKSDPTNVWDSNYTMVQHMGNSLVDSTGNGNDATNYGSTVVDSLNGKGRQFNGVDQALLVDDFSSVIPVGNMTNTLIMITKPLTDVATDQMFFGTQYTAGERYYVGRRKPTDNTIDIGFGLTAWNGINNLAVDDNIWQHLQFKVVSGLPTAYKNLMLADTGAIDTNVIPGGNFSIGAYTSAGSLIPNEYWYNGIIDEMRISNIARSDEWIDAEYKSLFGSLGILLPMRRATISVAIGIPIVSRI